MPSGLVEPGLFSSVETGENVVSLTVDGVRCWYMRPAAALAGLIIDYALYDTGPPDGRLRQDIFMPGPASVRLTFSDSSFRVSLARRRYEWGAAALLFGPSSYPMTTENRGGCMIGFGITPRGWARLIGTPAAALADRVVPLGEVLDAPAVEALREALNTARSGEAAKAVLDAFLLPRMATPHPDEPLIDAVAALVLDPEVADIGVLAARIGVCDRQLRRLTQRYFGFPPKLLLTRVRFLKAYVEMVRAGGGARLTQMAPGYFDHSHFIRDANRFLGTTARRFAAGATPFMKAQAYGRALLFGQPFRTLARSDSASLPD